MYKLRPIAEAIRPAKVQALTAGPKASKVPTLKKVLYDYLKHRRLKDSTKGDYEDSVYRCFKDWLPLPINEISKQDVAERHLTLSKGAPAQANHAMRVLRALFFFAMCKYDDANGDPLVTSNPVRILSTSRSWNPEKIRSNWIQPHQMKAWWLAVSQRPDPWCDYLQLLILTGLRKNEAARMRWDDVDFDAKTFTVRDTKTGGDHTLPMSDYLFELLKKRHAKGNFDQVGLAYVFPRVLRTGRPQAPTDRPRGYLVPHSASAKVPGAPDFCFHDLRRTFLTTAASLDFNSFLVKHLGNHKVTATGDITYRYVVRNVERLRKPMQQVTDEILRQAGIVSTRSESRERKSVEAPDADWQNYLL